MSRFVHAIDAHDLLAIAGLGSLNAGLVQVFSLGIALTVTGIILLGVVAWGMR